MQQESGERTPRANSAPPPQTMEDLAPPMQAPFPGKTHSAATSQEPSDKSSDGFVQADLSLKESSSAGEVGVGRRVLSKLEGRNLGPAGAARRRNEFHTLQEELHKKRTIGMRYVLRTTSSLQAGCLMTHFLYTSKSDLRDNNDKKYATARASCSFGYHAPFHCNQIVPTSVRHVVSETP